MQKKPTQNSEESPPRGRGRQEGSLRLSAGQVECPPPAEGGTEVPLVGGQLSKGREQAAERGGGRERRRKRCACLPLPSPPWPRAGRRAKEREFLATASTGYSWMKPNAHSTEPIASAVLAKYSCTRMIGYLPLFGKGSTHFVG